MKEHVGFVCVYGRANAGKSTLINKFLDLKLLPVSSKPQTTRDNVNAIYNDNNSQIIFTDTPGVFNPHGKLGSILLKDAENAKIGVDLILYVVDCSQPFDSELSNKLRYSKTPVLLAYNKIDLVSLDVGEKKLNKYLDILKDVPYLRICSKDGFGVKELLEKVKSYLPKGDSIYPDDIVSDRPKEYVISEIIREKCMRLLKDEVPHSIYVDLQSVKDEESILDIYANIIVEKESEKAIVIGKNGTMIKEISRFSEQSVKSFFGKDCCVYLNVKTIIDWRNSDKYLKKFGYKE